MRPAEVKGDRRRQPVWWGFEITHNTHSAATQNYPHVHVKVCNFMSCLQVKYPGVCHVCDKQIHAWKTISCKSCASCKYVYQREVCVWEGRGRGHPAVWGWKHEVIPGIPLSFVLGLDTSVSQVEGRDALAGLKKKRKTNLVAAPSAAFDWTAVGGNGGSCAKWIKLQVTRCGGSPLTRGWCHNHLLLKIDFHLSDTHTR